MPVADAEYETSSTPSQPGRSTELLPQHICIGLRSDAVSFDACETFQVLCRVVDSTFSHVSAEVLFELRAAAPDARAVRAFDSLVGPEAARLFEQGAGLQVGQVGGAQYDDFADLAIADITLAKALVAETKKIDSRLGGLYQGRLDHLRSTLCNPAAQFLAPAHDEQQPLQQPLQQLEEALGWRLRLRQLPSARQRAWQRQEAVPAHGAA